jgi:hypothetical protein
MTVLQAPPAAVIIAVSLILPVVLVFTVYELIRAFRALRSGQNRR